MNIGRIGLAVSLPALLAATGIPAQAADITYPSDPIYAPVPMALIGDLNFGIGVKSFDDGDFETGTEISVMGEGRVNIPVHGGTMQLQIDIGAYGYHYEYYDEAEAAFQGHLWHMRDNAAYGVFGGLGVPGAGPASWGFGVEGERYVGNTTLGAYASYSFGAIDEWTPFSVHVGGYVDHYVTPDHKAGIEIDYYGERKTGVDSQWGILLSGEKRVSGTPFSYWAEAGYDDWSGIYEGHVWGAMAGARVALGGTPGMTLQEHDRYLPWDNVGSLPVIWSGTRIE